MLDWLVGLLTASPGHNAPAFPYSAEGTHCKTQPEWRRESHSPCVSRASGAEPCEGGDCEPALKEAAAHVADKAAEHVEEGTFTDADGTVWHEALLVTANWEEW